MFVVLGFSKDSAETIHDVQFGLHDEQRDTLVTSDIGGMLNFFDIRGGERPFQKFVTHRGLATVNFDPSYYDRSLVVTGGRDSFSRVCKFPIILSSLSIGL